ncbi:ACT domain-containing protein, partial [Tanacetum coccineum]
MDIELCLGGLTNVGLRYVGEYGHNLRHLSLNYTGKSNAGLLELLKGCPKLRKLKLKGSPFSKQAIGTVFNLNHSLRHVWIDRYPADVLVLTRPVVSAKIIILRKLRKNMKVGLKVRSVVMRKKCKWDKDIVKPAFKTFQNRVNQLPSSDRTSTRPKQERKDAEMKKLRQKLTFKAKPMPSFYRTQGASKTTSQKASLDLFTIEPPLGLIQMGETRKEKASEAERSRLDDFTEDNLQEVACPSRSDDHTPEDKEDYEGGVEIKVCRNEKEVQADIFAVEGS